MPIRKYHFGAASVAIAALIFFANAGVVRAESVTPATAAETIVSASSDAPPGQDAPTGEESQTATEVAPAAPVETAKVATPQVAPAQEEPIQAEAPAPEAGPAETVKTPVDKTVLTTKLTALKVLVTQAQAKSVDTDALGISKIIQASDQLIEKGEDQAVIDEQVQKLEKAIEAVQVAIQKADAASKVKLAEKARLEEEKIQAEKAAEARANASKQGEKKDQAELDKTADKIEKTASQPAPTVPDQVAKAEEIPATSTLDKTKEEDSKRTAAKESLRQLASQVATVLEGIRPIQREGNADIIQKAEAVLQLVDTTLKTAQISLADIDQVYKRVERTRNSVMNASLRENSGVRDERNGRSMGKGTYLLAPEPDNFNEATVGYVTRKGDSNLYDEGTYLYATHGKQANERQPKWANVGGRVEVRTIRELVHMQVNKINGGYYWQIEFNNGHQPQTNPIYYFTIPKGQKITNIQFIQDGKTLANGSDPYDTWVNKNEKKDDLQLEVGTVNGVDQGGGNYRPFYTNVAGVGPNGVGRGTVTTLWDIVYNNPAAFHQTNHLKPEYLDTEKLYFDEINQNTGRIFAFRPKGVRRGEAYRILVTTTGDNNAPITYMAGYRSLQEAKHNNFFQMSGKNNVVATYKGEITGLKKTFLKGGGVGDLSEVDKIKQHTNVTNLANGSVKKLKDIDTVPGMSITNPPVTELGVFSEYNRFYGETGNDAQYNTSGYQKGDHILYYLAQERPTKSFIKFTSSYKVITQSDVYTLEVAEETALVKQGDAVKDASHYVTKFKDERNKYPDLGSVDSYTFAFPKTDNGHNQNASSLGVKSVEWVKADDKGIPEADKVNKLVGDKVKTAVKATIDGVVHYLEVPESMNLKAGSVLTEEQKTALVKEYKDNGSEVVVNSEKVGLIKQLKITYNDNSDSVDDSVAYQDVFFSNVQPAEYLPPQLTVLGASNITYGKPYTNSNNTTSVEDRVTVRVEKGQPLKLSIIADDEKTGKSGIAAFQYYALGSAAAHPADTTDIHEGTKWKKEISLTVNQVGEIDGYTFSATDGAGNIRALKLTLDVVEPDKAGPTITSNKGDNITIPVGVDPKITLTASDTATGDNGIDSFTITGEVPPGMTMSDPVSHGKDKVVTLSGIPYSRGSRRLTVKATDGRGNPTTKIINITVQDTEIPVVKIGDVTLTPTAPTTPTITIFKGADLAVPYKISDNSGNATVIVQDDGGLPQGVWFNSNPNATGNVTLRYTNDNPAYPSKPQAYTVNGRVADRAHLGKHILSVTATDQSGNSESKRAYINVLDVEAKTDATNKSLGDKTGSARDYVFTTDGKRQNGKLVEGNEFPPGTQFKWKDATGNLVDDLTLDTTGTITKTAVVIFPKDQQISRNKEQVEKTVTFKVAPQAPTVTTDLANQADMKPKITVTSLPNTDVVLYGGNEEIGRGHADASGSVAITPKRNLKFNEVVSATATQNGLTSEKGTEANQKAKRVVDGTGPMITKTPIVLTRGEAVPEDLPTLVTDTGGSGLAGVTVISVPKEANKPAEEKIPDFISYDAKTNKVALKSGTTVVPIDTPVGADGTKTYKARVNAIDAAGNLSNADVPITIQSQAHKYSPSATKVTLPVRGIREQGGTLTAADIKNQIKAAVTNMGSGTLADFTAPDISTVGTGRTVSLTVNYPDGSHDSVAVPLDVTDVLQPTVPTTASFDVYRGEKFEKTITITDNSGHVASASLVGTNKTPYSLERRSGMKTTFDAKTGVLTITGKEAGGIVTKTAELKAGDQPAEFVRWVLASDPSGNRNENAGPNGTGVVRPNDGRLTFVLHAQADKYMPAVDNATPPFVGSALTDSDKTSILGKVKVTDLSDEAKKDTAVNAQGGVAISLVDNGAIVNGTDANANQKVVKVEVKYPDLSTDVVEVLVKQDTQAPELTVPANVLVTREEDLPTIPAIKASDNRPGDSGLADTSVTGLPDFLQYNKATGTITLKTGATVPKTAVVENGTKAHTITVTAKDKVGNPTEKTFTITVQDQATKYAPTAKEQTVEYGVTADAGKSVDTTGLPGKPTVTWQTTPNTQLVGKQTDVALVTYPDGSTDPVNVTVKVKPAVPTVTTDLANQAGKTPEITVTSNAGATVTLYSGDKEIGAGVADVQGIAKITPSASLTYGAVISAKAGKDGVESDKGTGDKAKTVTDTIDPVIGEIADVTAIQGQPFTPISVTVTDEGGSGISNVTVEGLPEYLTYDSETHTIRLKEGSKVPTDAKAGRSEVTVTARDGAGRTTTAKFVVITEVALDGTVASPTNEAIEGQPYTSENVVVTPNKEGTTISTPTPVNGLSVGEDGKVTGTPSGIPWTGDEVEKEISIPVKLTNGKEEKDLTVKVKVLRDLDKDGKPDKTDEDIDGDGIPNAKDDTPREFTALDGTVASPTNEAIEGQPYTSENVVVTPNKEGTTISTPTPVNGLSVGEDGKVTGTPSGIPWTGDEVEKEISIPVKLTNGKEEKDLTVKVKVLPYSENGAGSTEEVLPEFPMDHVPTVDLEQKSNGDVVVTPTQPDGKPYESGTKVTVPGVPGEHEVGKDGKITIPNDKLPKQDVPGKVTITVPGGQPIEVAKPTTTPAQKQPSVEIVQGENGDVVITPTQPDGTPYESGTKVTVPGVPGEHEVGKDGKITIPNDQLPKQDVPGKVTITVPGGKPIEVDKPTVTPAQKLWAKGEPLQEPALSEFPLDQVPPVHAKGEPWQEPELPEFNGELPSEPGATPANPQVRPTSQTTRTDRPTPAQDTSKSSKKELPNTGTSESHLSALGILGMLTGLVALAGKKRKKDE